MTHIELFAGIGTCALAAEWAGFDPLTFVEIDPFCQRVLNKNFPGVPIHGDIKTFDAKPFRGGVDLLCGGFPCQPFSAAGESLRGRNCLTSSNVSRAVMSGIEGVRSSYDGIRIVLFTRHRCRRWNSRGISPRNFSVPPSLRIERVP